MNTNLGNLLGNLENYQLQTNMDNISALWNAASSGFEELDSKEDNLVPYTSQVRFNDSIDNRQNFYYEKLDLDTGEIIRYDGFTDEVMSLKLKY